MSLARIAVLPDRGIVTVEGEDARKLLSGIVTNDLDQLDDRPSDGASAMLAGLLSPQGKILFEFIVVYAGGHYLLDVDRASAAALAKRLTMYKLRAKVEITDASATSGVAAAWGEGAPVVPDGVVAYADPRHPELGRRLAGESAALAAMCIGGGSSIDYHDHRIACGVPEGGKDYDFGDAFPHEANFDLNGGVSFEKGCYVGQEIVARMEHRGTVRKRVVRIEGDQPLSAGRPDIAMGDVVIGKLGSVVSGGRMGLALVRLDRAIEAIDKAVPVTAAGVPIAVDPAKIARQRALMAAKASP